jgi:carbon monoxide dehydrogenase subunit G
MVEVKIDLRHTLQVGWDPVQALELVSNVPKSAAHFPGLQRLDELGGGVFRWNMNPFQISKFRHQVRYAALYITDTTQGTVIWTTEGTDNNTTADGKWTVIAHEGGSKLSFENRLHVRLPIPRLTGRIAKTLVPKIADKEHRIYLERIAATMDGHLLR